MHVLNHKRTSVNQIQLVLQVRIVGGKFNIEETMELKEQLSPLYHDLLACSNQDRTVVLCYTDLHLILTDTERA